MSRLSDKTIIILGVIFSFFITNIFLISSAFRGSAIDAANASQYGSFIGGYIGTPLSFLSILLLYLTLRNQKQSDHIEKFESKFFEMVKIHRENVAEIGIRDKYGRKVFVSLLREYREILRLVNSILEDSMDTIDISLEEKICISYLFFFYGIGSNSTRILRCALSNCNKNLVDILINKLNEKKEEIKEEKKFSYTPFEGHQSRLGHYYRHLYQTICYVDKQGFLDKAKYDYVKILRAQLSNHEQALLFLNSMSVIGRNWRSEGLLVKYRMIKNLPVSFFDEINEVDIKSFYPDLKFEWEE